jgi:ATP/maltotriose-dependent transcriptional regulator MalT
VRVAQSTRPLRYAAATSGSPSARAHRTTTSTGAPNFPGRPAVRDLGRALRQLGRQGAADLVERCCRLPRRFADRLAAFGDDATFDRVIDGCSTTWPGAPPWSRSPRRTRTSSGRRTHEVRLAAGPRLGDDAPVAVVGDARAAHARRESVLASRVVGRDLEIAGLRAALDRAVAGAGSVAFLVGEPGIGKSRLARVAADHAAQGGVSVLQGRAVSASTPLAYRPFAEALCGAVRGAVVADDAPGLDPFRPLLGWLVPEWREDAARVEDSVLALAEAVLRFLRAAARTGGCLLVLEDLHWADPETLRVVEYLADNLTSERVLCLATARDDGRSAGLDLARDLHARRVSTLTELSRLGPQDVAEMARSCLGADALPDGVLELAARSDGVPFLVEELLAAAVTAGDLVADGASWTRADTAEPIVPLTFSDSMRRRLDAVGAQTRAVLVAAAVLGRRFDWSLLSAITELDEGQVLAALRAAVDAQIVAVDRDEGTFRFRHALSRDAVLAELLPPERAALSRRAVAAVEAAHPELDDEWCQLAALLAEAAGQRSRAGILLAQAGRRSLARGALASAEAALERARGLLGPDQPTVVDVEELLCRVLSLAGKRDRAVEIGHTLLARLADDEGAAQRRAGVVLTMARAALAATHWDEAERLLEQARAETAAHDERLTAQVNALRAQTAIMRDPERAAELAHTALEAAERLGLPDVACEALEVLGRGERRRDLEAAEAAFARALALAEAHDLTVWRARALHELGTIDMLRGRSVARLQEARDLAVAQGALATAAVVDVQIAAALVFRDDPEPAAVVARRSAELARRYGLAQTLAAAVALEAYVHARTGRPAELQGCVREAWALAPGVPDIEVKIGSASAVHALIEEDWAAARRHLHEPVVRASRGPGGDYSATPAAGVLALIRELDGTGDERAAARLAEGSVHFVARAFFRYARAVAAGRAGDADGALALVAEADRTLGDHEWLRQLGRRLLAEAALADGWGRPVPWLREALAFFDRRGEQRIASACRSLLRRAGAPVPRQRVEAGVPAPLLAAGVTARELEVLRLLAEGLPNREIAARLYLSPRTVERHVANIAVKVGVAGRSHLVAFAARILP